MSKPHPICYLGGEYLALDAAKVSVLDRSFLFGDGIYEVIPVYDGKPFLAEAHLQRLANSLAAVSMECTENFADLINSLINRNGGGNMAVYIQVSRGTFSERDHNIPATSNPTVFAMTHDFPAASPSKLSDGLSGATCEDIRWLRCDIKATSLLANVLLKHQASQQDADEAILVRDGNVTEGASSSVFVVIGGLISTTPDARTLLPGTTRGLVVQVARELGLEVVKRNLPVDSIFAADEVWISSALREVLPITRIDGRTIGDGKPGPIWRRVYQGFQDAKRSAA